MKLLMKFPLANLGYNPIVPFSLFHLSSNVANVDDYDVRLSVNHEEVPNAYNIDRSSFILASRCGISFSRYPYSGKIIA